MKLSSIIAALLVTLTVQAAIAKDAAPIPTPKAEAERKLARAEQLYREATQLFRDRKIEQAVAKYKQALALKQTYDIAGNLGTAELALKRYTDAATHMALCLRIYPVNVSADERTVMRKYLATARAEIGTLTIVAPVGAEVTTGPRTLGTAPIEHDVYVDPGKMTLEARLEGHATTSVDVELVAGQELLVELPKGAPIATAVVPEDRSYVPEIVLGAVGVAAIATGAVFYGVAAGAYDQSQNYAALPGGANGCNLQSNAAACSAIADDIDSAYALSGAGIGMFVVGGGALATGVLHFVIVGPSEDSPDTAFRVSPMLGEVNGFQLGGMF